jgi:hypothetical protein
MIDPVVCSHSHVHQRQVNGKVAMGGSKADPINRKKEISRREPNAASHRDFEAVQDIARRETRLIRRLKLVLTTVLVLSSSVVAAYTFILLSWEQAENYRDAVSFFLVRNAFHVNNDSHVQCQHHVAV